MTIHERHCQWIEARGLDRGLAEKLGLYTKSDGGGHWLVVPYVEHAQVVNHKYRLTTDKRHRMDGGAPLCLWNHDLLLDPAVQNGSLSVIITEGEWDAIAAMTVGFHNVVSVPNGSSGADGKLDYLWRSKALLDAVGTIILATDGDDAGLKLGASLASFRHLSRRLQGSKRGFASRWPGRCHCRDQRVQAVPGARAVSPSGLPGA
jgi:twinkle protein